MGGRKKKGKKESGIFFGSVSTEGRKTRIQIHLHLLSCRSVYNDRLFDRDHVGCIISIHRIEKQKKVDPTLRLILNRIAKRRCIFQYRQPAGWTFCPVNLAEMILHLLIWLITRCLDCSQNREMITAGFELGAPGASPLPKEGRYTDLEVASMVAFFNDDRYSQSNIRFPIHHLYWRR